MSHEPECIPVVTKLHSANDACPLCTLTRAAYKRGREDAAKAVGDAYYMDYDLTGFIVVAQAAARGGEQ